MGLWAFAYVVLHLVAYLFFYTQFSFAALLEDVVKRAYITVGFLGFICLLPMALTSTLSLRRRLGQLWLRIHKLIYVAVGAGIVHFLWLTRDGYGEVILYLVWFLALILLRQKRRTS